MSRSIHSTRHELREILGSQFADPEERRRRVRAIRAALRIKRRIKAQIEGERAQIAAPTDTTAIEQIPIHVRDNGKFVHFPATPEDLRGALRLLPPGVADGLLEIELCLGMDEQRETDADEDAFVPDPLVGRRGVQWLPGVYAGPLLGTYSPRGRRIRLFAYVYDRAALPNSAMWELYLRMLMLETFAHEVAHHDDQSRRVLRGRWRGDNNIKDERYARALEFEWLRASIVTYLRQTYPREVAALLDWIARHGGTDIPLDRLVDDPRVPGSDAGRLSSTMLSVSRLAEHVARGRDELEVKLQFAESLHWAEEDDLAQAILERILEQDRDGAAEPWILLACIHRCVGAWDTARVAAEHAVLLAPESDAGWSILGYACEAQGDWPRVLQAATRPLSGSDKYRVRQRQRLVQSVRAQMELGMWDDVPTALEQLDELARILSHDGRFQKTCQGLRAEVMARMAALDWASGV